MTEMLTQVGIRATLRSSPTNQFFPKLIDGMRVEPDARQRRAMVGVALRIVHDDLPFIPLYRRRLNWAMNKKVTVVQWPSDVAELRWARVQ